MARDEFTDWCEFKRRLTSRFDTVKTPFPSTELLKQESIIDSSPKTELSCVRESIQNLKKIDSMDDHDSQEKPDACVSIALKTCCVDNLISQRKRNLTTTVSLDEIGVEEKHKWRSKIQGLWKKNVHGNVM